MPAPREVTERLPNPRWIPPFLGRVPVGIEHRHLEVVGLVALGLLFLSYFSSLLGSVLKYLAEDFGLAEADLGRFTGNVRLGIMLAFLLIPLADVIGRRRLFLFSVFGLVVFGILTGASQTPGQFLLVQIVHQVFVSAAFATGYVIVAEELPAAHRGWGIGMVQAVSAMGFALGAGLFAWIEVLPYGWRFLYLAGVLPLLCLPYLRRRLSETQRFRALQEESRAARMSLGGRLAAAYRPVAQLVRGFPGRVIAIGLLGALSSAGLAVAFQFTGFFVLEEHGWAPWHYTVMFVSCGALGVVGSPLAGRLVDRYGRRGVGAVALALFPLPVAVFYLGPSWSLAPAWAGFVFLNMGMHVVIRALGTEIFPTSYRGTAGGWLLLTEAVGAWLGLQLHTLGMQVRDDLGLVAAALSLLTLLAAFTLFFFPETAQRELEEISGEERGRC
ncbi:MAG: MFS transporter [Deltaproteobacteria bacterium]|nr:MFS transporter [Deltaproteobacteria bacterium]